MTDETAKKGRRREDTTVVFTDIHEALATPENESSGKPAALLAMGGDLNGTLFDLLEGESTFGREIDNTISLEFPGVSRKHFKIEIQGDKAILEDFGSRNGTFLNNKKLESTIELKKSDIIKIGSIALKFIPKGDPERLAYDKLNHEANTDKMTDCYNKAYFNNAADLEVKKSKLTGTPLSLIIFDFDHFKKLNDTYGHDAGDYVLKNGAQLIRLEGLREHDILARYGGEEFVILLPRTNIKHAFEVAERVRKMIFNHNFVYDNKKLPVSVSVGISDFRPGVETGVDLFKRADSALYQSKESGRNKVTFFKD
jgi:two-component system cell cycle response regulator